MSCTGGCPQGAHKHHKGLQLQSAHPGCSPGQSAGHLYDLRGLASSQEVDPVLSLVITRLQDGMLGKGQSKATDPPQSVSTGGIKTIYCSNKVSCTDGPGPGNLRRPAFSWFCQLHRGRLPSDDAMTRLAIWAWRACLILCVTGSSGLA